MKTKGVVILAGLLGLSLIGGGGALYWLGAQWHQHATQLTALEGQLRTLSHAQQATEADLMASIHKAQAQQLLRSAQETLQFVSYSLQLEGDVTAARSVLQQLASQFSTHTDESYEIFRSALASDIAALEAVTPFDRATLWAELTKVGATLSMARHTLMPPTERAPAAVEAPSSSHAQGWQVPVEKLLQGFKGLITVKPRSPETVGWLQSMAELTWHQRIQLFIEQAKWAMMSRQSFLYQTSLQALLDEIDKTIQGEMRVTLHAQVASLLEVDVQASIPTLDASTEALRVLVGS